MEQLLHLAAEVGLPITHLAMAFAVSHPGITSALLGARTMGHLDDLLLGVEVILTDDVLDRIDEIVPRVPMSGNWTRRTCRQASRRRSSVDVRWPSAPQPDGASA